ncbi:MAG: adenylate/guanylate cyclase domain-containing protein [Ignavibacteriae bacterium]|nr:adenylate/guanylate cyclase domain-containing protein [Ignavibacteriota bacterium]
MINKISKNLQTILSITIAWFLALSLHFWIIYMTLDEVNAPTSGIFNWIGFIIVLSLFFGGLSGLLEIYILRDKLKRLKFSYVVLYKTILFFMLFVVVVFVFFSFKNFILAPVGINFGNPPQENELLNFFKSTVFYKHGVIVIILSFIINFFFQINSKMGNGVLFNLFVGKYHSPRKEERIIMFLDLTSATTIAEEMPLSQYSLFLQDFFSVIDDAINETKGSIFQFVGDEVVILWDSKQGLENNNSIRFFFLAQKKILDLKDYFMDKFNAVPNFKAGLHSGSVVITEVGVTKQEIAYHGDTVNTAARIRSACNDVNKKFLVSAEILSQLTDIDMKYSVESVGLSNLKGKKNIVGLFSIEEKDGKPDL